ncbi:MAG: CBS domain-containing protein [Streptosporangiaceae bacterium]
MAEVSRRAFTVGELVHARTVTTGPDSPVAEAAAAMVREKVGSALVMQGPFLAGIITERDVLKAAASGADLTSIPVTAWMTKDPQAASPDTPAEDAATCPSCRGGRSAASSASGTCSPPGSAAGPSSAMPRVSLRRGGPVDRTGRSRQRSPGLKR